MPRIKIFSTLLDGSTRFVYLLFGFYFLFFIFYFLFFPQAVFAQNNSNITIACQKFNYPWCNLSEAERKSPAGIVRNIYQIALGLAGAAALGVLTYGGILWAVSGAVGDKKNALDYIKGALWGVVLLLAAVLILRTINPNLVDLSDPGVESVPARQTSPGPSASESEFFRNIPDLAGIFTHEQAVQVLRDQGIGITSSGNCFGRDAAGCTDFSNIRGEALSKLIMFKRICGFGDGELVASGAQERAGHGGNTTHGDGYTLDFSMRGGADNRISACLGNPGVSQRVRTTRLGPVYTLFDGSQALREDDHWHIRFSPI
ncbi:hypothetical protein HYV91_01275 [Candidatus Wolfebacteria bacterium]|nr:hypothetical protein [Candidatus Wolfebacteria bacterium]